MLPIEEDLVLKRRVHLHSGKEVTKSFRLLRCRYVSAMYEVYDIYDSQLSQELTLKLLIKNKQLSKQRSINEIKNQQLFIGLPQFISLYEIYEDSSFIYLIKERLGVSLGEVMERRGTMSEYEVQLVFSQLLDMVVELRKRNMAHGRISLETIYVDVKDRHRIKLGGFEASFNVGRYFQSLTVEESNRLSLETVQQIAENGKATQQLNRRQSRSVLNNYKKENSLKQLNPYTSPEQLRYGGSGKGDYLGYLMSLYEKDIWAVGIVLYRLLVGRYPFEMSSTGVQEESGDNIGTKIARRLSSDIVYSQQIYTSLLSPTLSPRDELAVRIVECSYSFYQEEGEMGESVSLQFSELIKSVLRPVEKRIGLKDLVMHPLRLRSYDNVRDVDLGQHLGQLDACRSLEVCHLGRVKQQLVDYHYHSLQLQQTKLDQQNQQIHPSSQMKYLTQSAGNPVFSLYNSHNQQSAFSLSNGSSCADQRYFYSWELNFGGLNQASSNSEDDGLRGDIGLTKDDQVGRSKRQSQQTHKLMGRRIRSGNKAKKDSQQGQCSSQSSALLSQGVFSRSASTHNFNIRSLNVSKKLIDSSNSPAVMLKRSNKVSQQLRSNNYEDKSQEENMSYPNILSQKLKTSIKNNNNLPIQDYKDQISQTLIDNTSEKMPKATESQSCLVGSKQQERYNNQMENLQQLRFLQSMCQELILKTHLQPIPLLVQEPEFVLQYRFDKGTKSLGYVLNNAVGVIFSNWKHIIGHNQTDFVIPDKKLAHPQLNRPNYYNCNYQPYGQSEKVGGSAQSNTLSQQEQQIYGSYLRLFGKRMMVSDFSLWILRYWRQGRVYVFLLNNGSWQVTFQNKKTSKFFIIDEHSLLWTKGRVAHQPEILNHVRRIVEHKRAEIIQQSFVN